MKQRFSSLDVTVIAHELSKSLCSLRVQNIYDLSSRIFLIKFQKPGQREQLIIESGFRCHLTQYARTTATEPSPFTERLRKILRTRRVTSVAQVGTDRVIEFQFSDGIFRLYLEFYAAGNIILTDADLKILALWRSVSEGEEHEQLRAGLKYDISMRQNYGGVPPLTKERIKAGLQKAIQRQEKDAASGKKSKAKEKDALRKALSTSIAEFPPLLMDHAFTVTGFDSTIKPNHILDDDDALDKLMLAFGEARKTINDITSADSAKGFILAKRTSTHQGENDTGGSSSSILYDDFHPFRPKQFEDNTETEFLEFEGFNKTVDEFFSSIEGQKLETRLQEREATAKRKLELAREDHAKRLGGLQDAQQLHIRKADAIKANVERVHEAMGAVNGLIEKGMDWVEIARLIEREQAQGNTVAHMIKLPLKLYENTVTLLLAEQTYDAESDEEGYHSSSTEPTSDSEDEPEGANRKKALLTPEDGRLAIDINLGLSPWQNANEYFDAKKNAAVKEEKTAQSLGKALKNTEKKIAADLKKGLQQEKEVLRPVRGKFWFEKFTYFISSDGYLVVGGKDVQQNELIYQRHLKKGDVYVYADLHGASPFVIKNLASTPDAPIPPSTLSQAGHLCVCTSAAWDSKAVMSAWWVNFDQVTKLGRTGEYLPVGAFNITGKKNFLPPTQLLLGFGVMFQITEESKINHIKHRVIGSEAGKDAEEGTDLDAGQAENGIRNIKHPASDSDGELPDDRLDSGSDDDEDTETRGPARNNPLESSVRPEKPSTDDDSSDEQTGAADDAGKFTMSGALGDLVTTEESGNDISKYRTARERRNIRKGEQETAEHQHIESGTESTTESQDEVQSKQQSTTAISSNTATQPTKQLPRGKRSKAKRLAAKYGEQDEEDRALALRLLGVQPVEQSAQTTKVADQKAKEEEAQAQKQRRREQHQRAQAAGKAAEEARRAALAEGGDKTGAATDQEPANYEPTAEELAAMQTPLDAFIGRPHPADSIVLAVPVCAPWTALSNYKYKVKLQPGTVKKGKAVKDILSKWEIAAKEPRNVDRESKDTERMWPGEIEAIRAWKEAEVYGVVPVAKVRVVQGGGVGGGKGSGGKGGSKGKGVKSSRGGRGSKKR
ncbi:hypothetical protein EJ05DRAFT_457690 [Pseudovirgaria hyperparasitica]|uniref:Ribosome quality control complex subunit 2 n=1 Tax=Pseudovirgaria hyperparasitica TaxID=470096 RepID=A0A6A6VVN2_9PEZI|nr:uncharacterized protein EJ05DRAFT_457690 [Pseudovirgaria hyperparasitica]KAF2753774.1 hypothetical protein EJ05DRAFT_457690 [Pseudovirgaria hyperparasitica]